ncbi:LCP family protein [Candidatus Shapirobacteria bacterium]|nr:LCP family protein [Candidatus Shapirobacteria bacterium]
MPKPFKIFLYSFLTLFLLFLLVIFSFSYWYVAKFTKTAGITFNDLKQILLATKNTQLGNFNFLILGLDSRPAEKTLLTDTIMVGLARPEKGKVFFLSLPRDLWIADLATKINALYYYGTKANSDDPAYLIKENIKAITGEEINYSILLNFGKISELVDLLGGVEIEVAEAFEDNAYPVDDGSGQTMTIRFEKGKQLMDGERALKYIRSRKSANSDEGNDLARNRRQLRVVKAVLAKVGSLDLLKDPSFAGQLYRFYNNLETELPVPVLLRLGEGYLRGKLSFEFLSLPEGLLTTPPVSKYSLWVFEPKAGDWGEIRKWVEEINGR